MWPSYCLICVSYITSAFGTCIQNTLQKNISVSFFFILAVLDSGKQYTNCMIDVIARIYEVLCLNQGYCTDLCPFSSYCVDRCRLSRYYVDICVHLVCTVWTYVRAVVTELLRGQILLVPSRLPD